jgi:hypothetical protein
LNNVNPSFALLVGVGVFCRVGDRFVHKQGNRDSLIGRHFDPATYVLMKKTIRKTVAKALADVLQVGAKLNPFKHLSLVKPLMGSSNGHNAGGSLVEMQFDFGPHGRRFQPKHTRHQSQAISNAMIDFLHKKLIAFKGCSQVCFYPLTLDGHSQDIRRALQKGNVVDGELALGSAIGL